LVVNPQTPNVEISVAPESFDDDLIMNKCIFNYGVFEKASHEAIPASDKNVKVVKTKSTKDDYVIHLILAMLQAFCLNEKISPIVPRVILNTFLV